VAVDAVGTGENEALDTGFPPRFQEVIRSLDIDREGIVSRFRPSGDVNNGFNARYGRPAIIQREQVPEHDFMGAAQLSAGEQSNVVVAG
jgi:hypothetical protein